MTGVHDQRPPTGRLDPATVAVVGGVTAVIGVLGLLARVALPQQATASWGLVGTGAGAVAVAMAWQRRRRQLQLTQPTSSAVDAPFVTMAPAPRALPPTGSDGPVAIGYRTLELPSTSAGTSPSDRLAR